VEQHQYTTTTTIPTSTTNAVVLPNIHYLPASIDNLTSVVEHVMDGTNDNQIQQIVQNANDWCKQQLTREVFINNAFNSLGMYQQALVQLGVIDDNGWSVNNNSSSSVVDNIDDLVECNV
jgi:alcohol dehydrogenase class IV